MDQLCFNHFPDDFFCDASKCIAPTGGDEVPLSQLYSVRCAKTCNHCDSQEFQDYINAVPDEKSCSLNEGYELGCHHRCARICTDGECVPTCTCNPGYEMGIGENCYDIDECKNNPCQIFQQCLNLPGRYNFLHSDWLSYK